MSVVEGLMRNFEEFKVEIPRWEILDSGVTALSGPSGSGKTTVLRMLIGLIPCPSLSWKFQNEDLAKLSIPDRRLGVVFQTLELFPHMTGEENIFFAARARKIPAAESAADFKKLTSELRLENCVNRSVQVLSGGERQRVALARALIGRPRLLLLDEPFSSLDVQMREEARTLVKSVIQKRNIPTILVTHDARDLEVLADRVDRIHAGKLVN
jgi:sulfate transport system ATP-binding protein/putative spermidine/putrescine transport system ATP-binding protein